MYDHIILSKIYKNQDYDTLVKLKSVKESLFQSADYLGMFDLLSSHLSTYGGFMADDHMDKFFVGERNSAVKDVWEQMKGTSVEDNTPILAVVELQLNSNLRHNIIQESHAVGVKLKTINNSESTETIKGYQSKINDLINASEKMRHKEEILRGDEAVENVKRYHEKSAQRGYFLSKYNIPFIDDVQGGVERGGFIGILASAKQRKSTVLRYIIYQQIIQGINCGIVTMEMSMESVREHIYILHANNSRIFGYSHPTITVNKVRQGFMTAEEKEYYYQVIKDFTTNPNYGHLEIKQPHAGYCFDDFKMDIMSMKLSSNVKIVAHDYLALMKPKMKGRSDVDDYNDMIMNTRYLSLDEEVTIMSPIQANRDGFSRVQKQKDLCYDLTAIHMYSAFEKGCTSILSVIQTDEMRSTNLLAIGSVVNREAPSFPTTNMIIDNESGYLHGNGEAPTESSAMRILEEIEL